MIRLYLNTEGIAMIDNVKGFTLLELMIAVSLGVILLGIGAPAMSSLLSENALRFESRNILKICGLLVIRQLIIRFQ